MRIGELSRRTGVNTHQLRYYEAQGLLEADRGANGYREYGESAVLRVKQIRHLLGAGLSSEDIAYLLPCAEGEAPELIGCPELLAAMRSRLRRLDEQMEQLARSHNALADYIDVAERIGRQSHPPFEEGAALEPTSPTGPAKPVESVESVVSA
ncbi:MULTISPECIES: MerR family transcriptional regulator [Streptomyces]|uniref:MerR family transcriptional regulator n=1 Tax=Streptomyces TaxID=1883 RepID=UPI00067DD2F1|nr:MULTISPECIES: MerR family transcriptional regulator [Streptomyces]KOT66631.1 MerR family transcriptional regulator [Streptomyces rimosus subsp. rimosus]